MRFSADGTPIPSTRSERREWLAILLVPLTVTFLVGLCCGLLIWVPLNGHTARPSVASQSKTLAPLTAPSAPPTPAPDGQPTGRLVDSSPNHPLYVIIVLTPTPTPSAAKIAKERAVQESTVTAEMTAVAYAPTALALTATVESLTPQPCDSSMDSGTICVPPTPTPLPTPTVPPCVGNLEGVPLCVVGRDGWSAEGDPTESSDSSPTFVD